MDTCSVSQVVGVVASVLALLVAPRAAAKLSPGLPGHPSVADYARCTVRSFLVTPKPPVTLRALPRGVAASSGRVEEAMKAAGAGRARG